MSTPIEVQASLGVGTIESVSASEIFASLDPEAPQTTALNTGSPVPFPRLNGFVLVPNEAGALVGLVTWIGISQSTSVQSARDSGLVDLPFPKRRMRFVPVGTLERGKGPGSGQDVILRRGAVVFPSVGDRVSLPTESQLRTLMRGGESDQRVLIGHSLAGTDVEIRVDPDKLFGRHLAVLGNTGSGKSCSVAGLIRWSMEAAKESFEDGPSTERTPNSRFIVLDPNGEYSRALSDLDGFVHLQVPPIEAEGASPLRVPAWLLNSKEWGNTVSAQTGVQQPVLSQALRHLRAGSVPEDSDEIKLAHLVAGHIVLITEISRNPRRYTEFVGFDGLARHLERLVESLEAFIGRAGVDERIAGTVADVQRISESRVNDRNFRSAFSQPDVLEIVATLEALAEDLPPAVAVPIGHEDVPLRFDVEELPELLDVVASLADYPDASRHLGGLKLRIRSLISDERIRPILIPEDEPELSEWLLEFLGDGSEASTVVIDLSLVPSDVVEVIVAVLSRVVFEALQRHRRINRDSLPTSIVLEEAHAFVNQWSGSDEFPTPGRMCTRTFERIAREGRKFGLGLVLASQRPSEISPTVLAQCNSFLLHRLVNDRDQQLVAKLVPDNLSGLLDDLPSLPARHALLLGWASVMPTLFEVRELSEENRPLSDDPRFWDVWTRRREVAVDWTVVESQWAGNGH